MSRLLMAAVVLSLGVSAGAQAPDGDAVLRGAGVTVPRGGSETAFNQGLTGPAPVPPGAFATLIIGMGPFDTGARVEATYAFGVLAGRSARAVPPTELAGANVALIQMLVGSDRRARIASARVSGRVYAPPLDGGPPPSRPSGIEATLLTMLNAPDEREQLAAMEALGLLQERAAIPVLLERYESFRKASRRAAAGGALEALTRIGAKEAEPIARALVGDEWGDRNDATGLVAAYARARFLEDESVERLKAALPDRTLGPQARAYLEEMGVAIP